MDIKSIVSLNTLLLILVVIVGIYLLKQLNKSFRIPVLGTMLEEV